MLSLYGARPLPEAAAPQLHRIVRVLAERAGLLAAPALYYVPLRPAQFSTTSTPSSRSARPSANDARARQTTWNP